MEDDLVKWDCVVYKTVWEEEQTVGYSVLVPPMLRVDLTSRISVDFFHSRRL